jgi:phenylalanyl-tRNA synthetase beta chain
MKYSINWLSDYVDLSGYTPDALAELITKRIAEVDAVEEYKEEGYSDQIIVVDNKAITHRADLWSHFGMARDLAAVLKRELKRDLDKLVDNTPEGVKLLSTLGGNKPGKYSVKISPDTKCRRFVAFEISGVRNIPTPTVMRRRLSALDSGEHGFLVDLSNYVMWDIGQPNHIFDIDKLNSSEIQVRMAHDQEQLEGLNGSVYTLTAQDIVVCDAKGAISLGGILGGKASSVSDDTNKILFEAASWDPIILRTTAKRHLVRTDAAMRFEKRPSPFLPTLALHRYVEILKENIPDIKTDVAVFDTFPLRPDPVKVTVRADYVQSRLSENVTASDQKEILRALNFAPVDKDATHYELSVPYYRATGDISMEDDIVEEVGRVYGYENIKDTPPVIQAVPSNRIPLAKFEEEISLLFRSLGFTECSTYSFFNEEMASHLGYDLTNTIRLQNPVDVSLSVMRTTLVPQMIQSIALNIKNSPNLKTGSAISLFELGRAFSLNTPEKRLLSLGFYSDQDDETLGQLLVPIITKGSHFWMLSGVIKKLLGLVSTKAVSFKKLDESSAKRWMHPYRSAAVMLGEKQVGILAEAIPDDSYEILPRTILAELDLDLLLSLREARKYSPFSRFPESFFEMSIVSKEETKYEKLEDLIRANTPTAVLKQILVQSIYRGKPLAEGEKSTSVKLILSAPDRTLTHEEVEQIQQGLIAAFNQNGNQSEYRLRS